MRSEKDGIGLLAKLEKNIIANSMTYDQLYPIFECAHQNNEPPKTWYENNIMRSLQPKKTSTGILGTLF